MASLDVDAMLARFSERAEAVKNRPLPPVAGEERKMFIEARDKDYLDFNLVGSATWAVEDDHLVLRIPLRPGD
jgi:hypothetical protein